MGNISTWGVTSDFYNNSDYNPAFNNLYTIEIFSPGDDSMKEYIKLQATAVSFGTDSLSLKRHAVTKKFHLEGNSFTWTDKLSITWRENDIWKVKKFHEDWLSRFYNKKYDTYISYNKREDADKMLFKTFRITLPAYEASKSQSILFNKVLPSSTGSLSLKWSQNPDVIEHTIEYYVEDWEWEGEKKTRNSVGFQSNTGGATSSILKKSGGSPNSSMTNFS